jgi:hypothetical protein
LAAVKKAPVVSALFLAALLAVLWFAGRPAYHRFKEKRSLAQAEKFLVRGDYRNTSLSARQVLAANPRNLRACSIMAELADIARAPQVLDWRRRLSELSPTPENKLLLASAALRVQGPPYPLAAQALEELGPFATNLAAFHLVSAELALKLNRPATAEQHFEAATRLEPTNELHRLNLAVLRLRSTNAILAAEAQTTLQALSASTNHSAVALRWLMADHFERKEFEAALQCSTRLLASPQCVLEDRMQHLSILWEAKKPAFDNFLSETRRWVAANASGIYALNAWMIGHDRVAEARLWLASLPVQVRAEQPVPLAVVDCYTAAKDWRGLDGFLQEQKWGDLEFMRHAFLSQCAAEQKDALSADAHWRLALKEAGGRVGPLISMLTMAASWGRAEAEEDLLWRIVQKSPRERWAVRELDRRYGVQGNTRGLNKLYGRIMNYDPKNVIARNNFAATSLLLKINLARAHEIARQLFLACPDDPVVASTYALSRHLQGRTADGLGVLAKLKPELLDQPSLALYYGILLQADRQTNKAGRYLELARKAPLLPEERALAALASPPTQ